MVRAWRNRKSKNREWWEIQKPRDYTLLLSERYISGKAKGKLTPINVIYIKNRTVFYVVWNSP